MPEESEPVETQAENLLSFCITLLLIRSKTTTDHHLSISG